LHFRARSPARPASNQALTHTNTGRCAAGKRALLLHSKAPVVGGTGLGPASRIGMALAEPVVPKPVGGFRCAGIIAKPCVAKPVRVAVSPACRGGRGFLPKAVVPKAVIAEAVGVTRLCGGSGRRAVAAKAVVTEAIPRLVGRRGRAG